MFYLKEPASLNQPWVLSSLGDADSVTISTDVTKDLKNYHILGINFLYQNYKSKLKGAILNEEDGMNMIIQVSAFLNAIYRSNEKQFLILVVCPDHQIKFWNYHLSVHGKLTVKIVQADSCLDGFDNETGLALVLGTSNLKMAEQLAEYDYYSIIIDDHDLVATKMVLKKLNSVFNIGLTRRNFYMNPDQKLQWTMLNWSNPGCVGKLKDFSEIDNDNLEYFRDNYRHWWFRLTWHFCESFVEITDKELKDYQQKVNHWGKFKNDVSKNILNTPTITEVTKESKKSESKSVKTRGIMYKNPPQSKITVNQNTIKNESVSQVAEEKCSPKQCASNTSSARKECTEKSRIHLKSLSSKKAEFIDCSIKTITVSPKKGKRKISHELLDTNFDNERTPEVVPLEELFHHSLLNDSGSKRTKIHTEDSKLSDYVKLPSMDEVPIVNSIIENLEKSPGPAKKQPFKFNTSKINEPNCSKAFNYEERDKDDYEDILKSISCEDSEKYFAGHETNISNVQEEEFFKSLVDTNKIDDSDEDTVIIESETSKIVEPIEDEAEKSNSNASLMDDDIEKLLRETDKMLVDHKL